MELPPQHETCLLADVFRILRVWDQRVDVPQDPLLMLAEKPQKSVSFLQ
jgi:hypothetical protein